MKIFSIDGTSGGSGWGVAKVGSVTVSPYTKETVNIADLGITSVDDYIVVNNSKELDADGWSGAYTLNKTPQSFDLFIDGTYPVRVTYLVIAKGYGGGGGGGQ